MPESSRLVSQYSEIFLNKRSREIEAKKKHVPMQNGKLNWQKSYSLSQMHKASYIMP